jgi:carbon-monoxide dehydrogenase medium subunit
LQSQAGALDKIDSERRLSMIKDFEYFAPKTVEEALALLSKYKGDAKLIAGGQSLLILMRQGLVTPRYLIDIKGISSLDYIKFNPKEGLRIGSLATHRAIEKSSAIQSRFSVIAEMEKRIADVENRNWGTIGGNLCHADPVGDPAPVLIALDGKLKIASLSANKSIGIEDFFLDYFETALHTDEILTEIEVPNPLPHTGAAYDKTTAIEVDYSIVSAAVSITLGSKSNTCTNARIVLGAVANVPLRAKKAEKVLVGKEITDNSIEEAAQIASEEARPTSDIHASEVYRRDLVKVLVRRVGREALERAKRT